MLNGKGTYHISCMTANHPKNQILNNEKIIYPILFESLCRTRDSLLLTAIEIENLDVTVSIEHLRCRNTEIRR